MNIDPKTRIAGFASIAVRNCLRRLLDWDWTAEDVKSLLKATEAQADELLQVLHQNGYIEPVDHRLQTWRTTVKGNALALASAARPISRAIAERELQRFLERTAEVRDSTYWLWKVNRAILFGSLLTTDKPKVSDVDIAVELVPKEKDPGKLSKLVQARIEAVIKSGKRFRNLTEEVSWPYFEVFRFLKSGSRVISLHDFAVEARILQDVEVKVIYEDEEAVANRSSS